ncbi:sulfite exporter TauE/SafE family protein [Bacillus salacetis]|uniref:urease accessory protein UreH domain-containing protein n=1 Tax=Bacillus salacetis TaxID=2315464 RepID=UPI003B9F2318
MFAFILGIVGTLAPCQFTGNIGAITLYGNKSLQKGLAWSEVAFFTLGKILTFTAIGLLAWSLGNEFQQEITEFFPWMRKVIGPVLLLAGHKQLIRQPALNLRKTTQTSLGRNLK